MRNPGPSSKSPRHCAGACTAFLIVLGPLGGCVNDDHKGMEISQPLPVRSDIHPDQLALMASAPADGNADGFPDQYIVEAYLTMNDPKFIEPVAVEGSFTFTVTDETETTIEHWVVPEQTARLGVRTIRGLTTYRFLLDARRPSPEAVPPKALTMHASFEPADGGAPVHTALTLPFSGR
ncbi:MAG: hypothetical protein IT439_08580 [Phycisphaerales bacterium]|nr:hypothetical protein [Phycisphaerales bacterium]